MRTTKSFHQTPLPNRLHYDISDDWSCTEGRIGTEKELLLRRKETRQEDSEMALYMAQALL